MNHRAADTKRTATRMNLLVDSFGRIAEDLRISVTDRCNFRCTYCMPTGIVDWIPRNEILSFEELARLASICVELGIRSVRLTGGESLVRAHLERLVSSLAKLPLDDLALTTNGYLLEEKAETLAAAGLRRVNVSLDSLDRDRFKKITGADALEKVLAGIEAARVAGLEPVKINCVVMRSVNDDELVDFAYFAQSNSLHVRFIEFMPLDGSRSWEMSEVVTASEILDRLSGHFDLIPDDSSGPAEIYRFAGQEEAGSVGIIASVSRPFCDRCNRIRITADGQLRTCLFALEETDLKGLLRSGACDDEIASVIQRSVAAKWRGHRIGSADFCRPERSMFAIGG